MGLIAEWDIPAASAGVDVPTISDHAWDAALVESGLIDFLPGSIHHAEVDESDIASGLAQVDRYLARSWARAGLSPQKFDDCTQAVYASLLEGMGRGRFDRMLGEVGQSGIREVLSRETAEGPDFFRAIDTVKKRAQRERSFQPLDAAAEIQASTDPRSETAQDDLRASLRDAVARTLSPREAALIRSTLQGETPAEIAEHWGVAPKTVSNEKTRALQKLREVLVSDLDF
ncbi:RNA polymerase sigma factor [Tundrisphaera sp. TA3]|uniref:RNA polymerase sigma factor n=1 Tax=Tundrisphaera sp. TA3 TaxID=3435775 RepID=UPI003EBB974E